MVELDQYKLKINEYKEPMKELKTALRLDEKQEKIREYADLFDTIEKLV